jgi:hypothetical protein
VNPIFEAALEVDSFCRDRQWRFCFIGGIAVLRWGEPRLTRDADLTLLTGYGTEAPYIDALVARFEGRLDNTAGFALRNRVVLLRASNGTPIDVALGALPFEEHAIDRATPFAVGDDNSIVTCSAGDLVVHKVFAGRDRDWLDVEGVLVRQAGALDWDLILTELRPLLELKEDREAEARLVATRDRLGRS